MNNMDPANDKFASLNYRYMDDSVYDRHQSPALELETTYNDKNWQYSRNREDIFSVAADLKELDYSEEEKALVRKIDFLILPIICTLDFLQVNTHSTVSDLNSNHFKYSSLINQPSTTLL